MTSHPRFHGGVLACMLALTVASSAQTPAPQGSTAVFRAGADAVTVDASVQQDRRPIAGLKAADFELIDNGVPQEITDVAYERLPIDVTMLLDVSASVTGQVLDELRRALRQVRSDLTPADRLRLVAFNMSVRRLMDFGEAADVDRAIASVHAGGSSAVFDGLAVALTAADAPGRRRLIILFSDGQDSSSISDIDGLLAVARQTTATVAVILSSPSLERPASLLRAGSSHPNVTIGATLDRIAAETGGMVSVLKPGETVSSKFRRMLQDFRSSYVLYFTPKGVERSGVHTLDVRVKRTGADVRARRGYVWR